MARRVWTAVWPWLRRVLIGIGGLMVAALFVAIGFVIFLHTDSGRNWVKGKVETALSDELRGEVRIGRLTGSVFSNLTLHNVEVTDEAGTRVIEVDKLSVDYSVWALLDKRVVVDSAHVLGARVRVRQFADGTINLAKLLKKKEKKPDDDKDDDSGGGGWKVHVGTLTVEAGSATLDRPNQPTQHIDRIGLDVRGVGLVGADVSTDSVSLDATWREQSVTANVRGVAAVVGGTVVGKVKVDAVDGERTLGTLDISDVDVSTDLKRVALALAVDIDRDAAKRLPGELATKWRGDISIDGRIQRYTPSEPIDVDLNGFVAGAPVSLIAAIVPEDKHAWMSTVVTGFDPSSALLGSPVGAVNVRVDADVRGKDLASLKARYTVDTDGAVDTIELRGLALAGDASAGRTQFNGVLDSEQGSGNVSGEVDYLARPVEVLQLLVTGYVGEFRRLLPEGKLRGSAWVSLKAKGNVDALDVKGTARLRRIRHGTNWVPAARANFRVTGSVKAPVVNATLTAARVRAGKDWFQAVSVRGRSLDKKGKKIAVTMSAGTKGTTNSLSAGATVNLGEKTNVQLGWMRGRVRGLTWKSTRGAAISLSKDGNVRVSGVRLASRAGTVRVDGTLYGGLRIVVKRLTIAELARALELPKPHPRGVVELVARVRKSGKRFLGSAQGSVGGFALAAGRPEVAGDFNATLGWKKATLVSNLSGAGIGKLHIDANARPPYRNTDVAAWKRFGSRAVRSAELSLTKINLRGAQAFLGKTTRLAGGLVSGKLSLGAGAAGATGKITARHIRFVGSTERAHGTFDVIAKAGRLTLLSNVDGRIVGKLHADVQVHVPLDLLDVNRWKRLQEYSVISAKFTARNLDLRRMRKLVPSMPKMRGIVTATTKTSAHAHTTVVTAQVRRLRNTRTAGRPVDADLRATIGLTSTQVALETRVRRVPVSNTTGTVAAGFQTLRTGGVDGLKQAVVKLKSTLKGLPLRLVADALDLEQRRRISGAMGASLKVSGTALQPIVSAQADFSGAKIDKVSFSTFDVRANLGAKSATASATARQAEGGMLSAVVTMRRTGKRPVQGAITSKKFDLRFLRGLERGDDPRYSGIGGLADIKLTLAGTVESPQVTGDVDVLKGTLRVRKLAPLHDGTVNVTVTRNKLTAKLNALSGSGSVNGSLVGRIRNRKLTGIDGNVRTRKFPFVTSNRYKFKVDSRTKLKARPGKGMWNVEADVLSATVRLPGFSKERSLHSIDSLDDVEYIDGKRLSKKKPENVISLADLKEARPWLRVKVRAPETIRLRSDLVQATATADLVVTLVGGAIVIQGTARTTRGRVEILDRRYDIRTAKLTFDGQVPSNPRVAVKISHAFDSLTLYTELTGRATDINPPRFTSDPGGYDRSTLLGFFLGRDPDKDTTDDSPLQDKAVSLASNFIAGQVQKYVKELLPIDVLKVEVDDASSGASAVTVGKWINDDLFIAYKYSPVADENSNINEAQVEYRIFKRWSLEGTYGDNGKGGIDILWIRRY